MLECNCLLYRGFRENKLPVDVWVNWLYTGSSFHLKGLLVCFFVFSFSFSAAWGDLGSSILKCVIWCVCMNLWATKKIHVSSVSNKIRPGLLCKIFFWKTASVWEWSWVRGECMCAGWPAGFIKPVVLQGLVSSSELFTAEWRATWLPVKSFFSLSFLSQFLLSISLSACFPLHPCPLPPCLCLFLSSPPSTSGSKGWWSVKLESVSYSALWLHVLSYKL